MSAWAISGLKPSAFLAADGRHIRLGMQADPALNEAIAEVEVLMIGLRTNHRPPIFTRLVSHATRFAILGSPVRPTTVNTGETSQLCLVGQTVVQYFRLKT